MNTTRNPAVEGRFYGSSRESISGLIGQIDRKIKATQGQLFPKEVFGAVLPHAGHIFSGYQTVPFMRLIRDSGIVPDTWIIVHPNHRGVGPDVALDEHTGWRNAMGVLMVDSELSRLLPYEKDASAHDSEHSCEVLLPYLQYYFPEQDYQILPLSMKDQSFGQAHALGKEIHRAVLESGKRVLLLASSDFSHFETAETGYAKDQHVLEAIEKRDVQGVGLAVRNQGISVCGYGPIMTLMSYAEEIDPLYKTEVLARGHSGDVSPSPEVVDYISILFYR